MGFWSFGSIMCAWRETWPDVQGIPHVCQCLGEHEEDIPESSGQLETSHHPPNSASETNATDDTQVETTTQPEVDGVSVTPTRQDEPSRIGTLLTLAENTQAQHEKELEDRGRRYVANLVAEVGRKDPEAAEYCTAWSESLTKSTLKKYGSSPDEMDVVKGYLKWMRKVSGRDDSTDRALESESDVAGRGTGDEKDDDS